MTDKPKRLILAKAQCHTCQCPVSVEVPEPDPVVETKTAPCSCGRTEMERTARWIVLGFVALFLAFMGSCMTNQYFTTQQIKAIADKYQVRHATPGDKPFFNDPDFIVEPKPTPAEVQKK